MKSECFEISDKLLESTKLSTSYCKKSRLILGFKTLQEITINKIPYMKVKGIDINYKTKKIEIATDKETIKLKYNTFENINIDNDLNININ